MGMKLEWPISCACKFKGSVSNIDEIPIISDTGDIWIIDGEEYVYTGSSWECLTVDNDYLTQSDSVTASKEVKTTICPRCSAPLMIDKARHDGTCKCEFCGSFTYVY